MLGATANGGQSIAKIFKSRRIVSWCRRCRGHE
jgi:hypothetical protein